MSKSILLSDERYEMLVKAARREGFEIKPGAGSQLGEYIEHLVKSRPPWPIKGKDNAARWELFLQAIQPYVSQLFLALDGKVSMTFDSGDGRLEIRADEAAE